MRHLRPLPPIDDPDQDWYLASGTALFAATPKGLKVAKKYVRKFFQSGSVAESPVDLVLCTGSLSPDGEFATIRRVERPIDLLDNWAPIGSDVPDPSLEKMKSNYERLKARKEEGEFEGAEKQARWYLQKMQDDIYQVEGGLEELTIKQEDLWGLDYPAICPEEVTPEFA